MAVDTTSTACCIVLIERHYSWNQGQARFVQPRYIVARQVLPDKPVPFEFRLQCSPPCTAVCFVYPCVLLCTCMFKDHTNTTSCHLIRSALRPSTTLRSSTASGNGDLFLDAMQSLAIIRLPSHHTCLICFPSLYNKVQPVWFSSAAGTPCQEDSARIGKPARSASLSQCHDQNGSIANTPQAIFSSCSHSVQQKGKHRSQLASSATPLMSTLLPQAPSAPSLAVGATPQGPTFTPMVPNMTPQTVASSLTAEKVSEAKECPSVTAVKEVCLQASPRDATDYKTVC